MGRKKRSRASTTEKDEIEMDNDGRRTTETSLYEFIGVERTATPQEIRKAYHKLALRLHPDKNQDDEEAKEKFQHLRSVISILGDEEKRAVYDQTGSTDDDDLFVDALRNWWQLFRSMYKKVTEADIEEFKADYRGSESEKKDLIDLFIKFKGKMNRVFCSMLCSDAKLDSHRFKDILDDAIAAGDVKSSKAYEKWAKKISETKPPTRPLRRKRKRKPAKDSSETDVCLLIAQRTQERKRSVDAMFSSLISRYGDNGETEPTEEEFEAARKRIESRRPSKKLRVKK